MKRAYALDGGAFCRTAFLSVNNDATAGSTGDATEVSTSYVNRDLEDIGIAQSAKLIITYTATLAADETLTFAGNFQDATDSAGTGVADFSDAWTAKTVATGDSGGSTETGTFEVDVDLSGAKQYVRAQITPNLSASATDTCNWTATLVLFGDQRQPSTGADVKIGNADAI